MRRVRALLRGRLVRGVRRIAWFGSRCDLRETKHCEKDKHRTRLSGLHEHGESSFARTRCYAVPLGACERR